MLYHTFVLLALSSAFVSAQEAICVLQPTRHNPDQTLVGTFTFSQVDESAYDVAYSIDGLTEGNHTYRVHEYGSLHSTDASATGGQFVGDCTMCRPTIEEVGALNDGEPLTATVGGEADGTFVDTVIRFVGVNSIIGRSIVVYGDGADADIRVAQCVIGRNNDEDEFTTAEVNNGDGVTKANCILSPGDLAAGEEAGHITFTQDDNELLVEMWISEFSEDGGHTFHVHDRGNIEDAASNSQGDHFVGDIMIIGGGTRTGVGQLSPNNDTHDGVTSTDGRGSWVFTDAFAKLNGVNSIVGRSIVVHEPMTEDRIGHCVIGIEEVTPTMTDAITSTGFEPVVLGAHAVMEPSDGSEVYGTIQFALEDDSIELRYFFTGLTPGAHDWHVHEWGAVQSDNASATGGHFVGECDACRTGDLQEVGAINDNTPIMANEDGHAIGVITDAILEFNGPNSIVGRSVVVYGDDTDTEVRVAQGVIGRAEDHETATVGADVRQKFGNESICEVDDFVENGWILSDINEHECTDEFASLWCADDCDGRQSMMVAEDSVVHLTVGISYNNSHNCRGRVLLNEQVVWEATATSDPETIVFNAAAGDTFAIAELDLCRVDLYDLYVQPVAQPRPSDLMCTIQPTQDDDGFNAAGYVMFARPDIFGDITVTYNISGLAEGNHNWHVHSWGNLLSNEDGASTGPHFGIGAVMRPEGPNPTEVGSINNGAPIEASADGIAEGSFVDNFLAFEGPNSIVGRAIVIDAVDAAPREAYCAIGVQNELAVTITHETDEPTGVPTPATVPSVTAAPTPAPTPAVTDATNATVPTPATPTPATPTPTPQVVDSASSATLSTLVIVCCAAFASLW